MARPAAAVPRLRAAAGSPARHRADRAHARRPGRPDRAGRADRPPPEGPDVTDTPGPAGDGRDGTAARMHAIAAELAAAGLDARVHSTGGGLDITASLGQPRGRPAGGIVDEDGYVGI